MLFGVQWTLLTFEIISYLVWGICCVHALRQPARRERLALLIMGTAYGVTLEALTIYQLHAYHYGHFLVMFIGQIPLAIGVGWGIILYAAIAFADTLRLAPAAWAVTVGLVGLNIDATMDAVAIRLGMWNWHQWDFARGTYAVIPGTTDYVLVGPTTQWFGVPFGNFYAWFIVLTSCAAFFRWYQPGNARTWLGTVGRSAGTLLSSVLVLGVLDQVYTSFFNFTWWPVAVEIVGSAVILVVFARSRSAIQRAPGATAGIPVAFLVPLFFHLYFLGTLIALAIDPALAPRTDIAQSIVGQLPMLATITGVMTIVGLGVHLIRRQPVPPSPIAASIAVTSDVHHESANS